MADDIKAQLADEESTKKGSLTRSDRNLLRGYFGFSPVIQCPEFPVRRLADASSYVKSMLLTPDEKSKATIGGVEKNNNNNNNNNNKQQQQQQQQQQETNRMEEDSKESDPFDLTVLLDGNMPRIFDHSMDNLIQLFREGSTFTDSQMAGVLRTFSAFSRLYERDLAISSGYCRLLLIGPVRETHTHTHKQT